MNKEFTSKMTDTLKDIAIDLIAIVLIILIARIVFQIVSRITKKAMENADRMEDKEKGQQIKTSMTLTHSLNRYAIYLIAIFLIFKQIGLGEQISGAVVAAGIGGLVISLGTQSIVKDIMAGLVILFERQYYVGDYVKIGDYEGTVTSMALRVTYLESSGKKIIIPNGQITNVINYSRTDGVATIKIPTPYEANTKEVMAVIEEAVNGYYENNRLILTDEKPQILGISELGDNAVMITIVIKTQPLKFWKVEREVRLLIKEEFDKRGISIPYQQIVLHK